MSKKATEHHKTAEQHTHAARHHTEAAKYQEGGQHEKAAHHATLPVVMVITRHTTPRKPVRRTWKNTGRSNTTHLRAASGLIALNARVEVEGLS